MIAIGIDQGITSHGIGVVLIRDAHGEADLLDYTEINVSKIAKRDIHAGIWEAYKQIDEFVFRHHPQRLTVNVIGIEWPHVKGAQTALNLAMFAGAVLTIAGDAGVPFYRIAVPTAKKALTGYGKAEKRDMVRMAEHLFGVKVSDHVADALGVAIAAVAKHKDELLWDASRAAI